MLSLLKRCVNGHSSFVLVEPSLPEQDMHQYIVLKWLFGFILLSNYLIDGLLLIWRIFIRFLLLLILLLLLAFPPLEHVAFLLNRNLR